MHDPADLVPQRGVEHLLGADEVGGGEVRRAGDGPVHVRLRGEVHDRVVPGQRGVQRGGVADVAPHEPVPRGVRDRRQVREVARVGQLVEDRDLGVLVARVRAAEQAADIVGADESGTAGDEQAHQRGNLP